MHLGKQPEGRYVSSAKKLSKADPGDVVKFVDPTGPVGGSCCKLNSNQV